MIANARMYSVDPMTAELWRALLEAVIHQAAVPVTLLDYPAPAPLEVLWQRPDLGAVFMCGLPLSRAATPPCLIAAPIPSPVAFGDAPRYWSAFVVRNDSRYQSVTDTFGGRMAFTVPDSQSGYGAALSFLMDTAPQDSCRAPLFDEIVAPTVTPMGALSAVIRGDADVAPLDGYAFHLLQRYRPDVTDQIRVVGSTLPTPIPPLVGTSQYQMPLRQAFLEAHEHSSTRALMEKLLLSRFAAPEIASYDVLRERFEAATRFWGNRPLARVTHPAFVLNPVFAP